MIIYNVTLNVDESIHDEWMIWMHSTHVPEVMATGKFHSFNMLRLLTRQSDETGETYAIQYKASSIEDYMAYQEQFAPALQQKTIEKYGNKILAFRTLMEEVEQFK
jgi:hypothetical protein